MATVQRAHPAVVFDIMASDVPEAFIEEIDLDTGRAGELRQLESAVPFVQAQRHAVLLQCRRSPTRFPTIRDRACLLRLSRASSHPVLAQRLPVGDGAAMLRRRPDRRQAERKRAAATARIGVVTADLYAKAKFPWTPPNTGRIAQAGAENVGYADNSRPANRFHTCRAARRNTKSGPIPRVDRLRR